MKLWASKHISALNKSESITIRPQGRSMEPLIMSGQEVIIIRVTDATRLDIGDIVLCRVNGAHYLHNITGGRSFGSTFKYRISNNKGGTNGWIPREQIFGKLV